jgi:pectate lyase
MRRLALVLATIATGVLAASAPVDSAPPALAFPGAVGYAKMATGGRGGTVIPVTNLNDSGAGSLRECIQATGARTCVFRVGGTIQIVNALQISNDNITIAGQTAPGDGIQIITGTTDPAGSNHGVIISADNVIIRHIRMRMQYPGEGSVGEVLNADSFAVVATGDQVYLDHVSAAWATDENMNGFGNWKRITVAYSIWAEGLDDHSKCTLMGDNATTDQYFTWYRNLCISNNDRNPNVQQGPGCTDVMDSVFYNPQSEFAEIFSQDSDTPVNFVGNYFKAGPLTNSSTTAIFWNPTGDLFGGPRIYVRDNVTYAPAGKTITFMDATTQSHVEADPVCPFSATPIAGGGAAAYNEVKNYAGAWPRDTLDATYMTQLGNLGANGTGISNLRSTPGTPPTLTGGTAYTDADADGMADTWELARGLSPAFAGDRNMDRNRDGYTNLDEYLDYRHREVMGLSLPSPCCRNREAWGSNH